MRILPPIFCVLLLVGGVSGVDMKKVTLSVMKGDNVTLKPDDAVIPTDDQILWKFEGSIIVNMKNLKDGVLSTFDLADGRFKEKLLLDKKTGSLTITNLATDNTGTYQLEIKSTTEIFKNYSVTVLDVVESVSVMEGDSVTLRTIAKVQRDDQILWKFGNQGTIIARLNGPADEQSNIHLNNQTGDLTIRNIRRDQTGDYKMEINTSGMILYRKLPIDISVKGGVKTISVKEGEIIILNTGVTEIEGYNLILWKTEDDIVGEINKNTKIHFIDEERFKGRLQLHPQTGSLIISNSRTTESGVYQLQMNSSSHCLQRTISVTVSAQSGAASGICGAGVGLVVCAVTVFLLQVV